MSSVSNANVTASSEVVNVGRHPNNDLIVSHSDVSGFHCRYWFDGRQWQVQDLDSTNGTSVNGTRVVLASIKDGDRISIGPVDFVFKNGILTSSQREADRTSRELFHFTKETEQPVESRRRTSIAVVLVAFIVATLAIVFSMRQGNSGNAESVGPSSSPIDPEIDASIDCTLSYFDQINDDDVRIDSTGIYVQSIVGVNYNASISVTNYTEKPGSFTVRWVTIDKRGSVFGEGIWSQFVDSGKTLTMESLEYEQAPTSLMFDLDEKFECKITSSSYSLS